MVWLLIGVLIYAIGFLLVAAALQKDLVRWPRRTALLIVLWPVLVTVGIIVSVMALIYDLTPQGRREAGRRRQSGA